jgi:hypothetical protein
MRAYERQAVAPLQHRGLAHHDLKKCHGNLADIRTAGKNLVGATADVSEIHKTKLVGTAWSPHKPYMSFTFVNRTRNWPRVLPGGWGLSLILTTNLWEASRVSSLVFSYT